MRNWTVTIVTVARGWAMGNSHYFQVEAMDSMGAVNKAMELLPAPNAEEYINLIHVSLPW